MQVDEVVAHVQERIGLEIQAIGRVNTRIRGHDAPHVWTIMTEPGYFWFVEDGVRFEVFRALQSRNVPASSTSCYSAGDAARLFRSIHLTAPPVARNDPHDAQQGAAASSAGTSGASREAARSFSCEVCGTSVTRRRPLSPNARALCPRCRHAERERLRYQLDPEYRERRLAYSAARYRQAQEQHAS